MYTDIQCICYAQCNDFKIHVQCIEYIYSVTCRMQCLYTTYMYNDEQFHVYINIQYIHNAVCIIHVQCRLYVLLLCTKRT